MANDDLDSGRDPDEEEPFQVLFQRAENGKNFVDIRPSICMVPSVLRDLSEKSFIPRVVSVGPLHKENENLQEFERLKDSYLHDLFSRSGDRTRTLEECLKKVSDLMEDIRSSYDVQMIKKYKDTELANMMVLDGSFILEFCFKQDNKEPTLLSKIQITWTTIDLMLLENQIPFIVLQAIFNCTIKKSHPKKISLTCLLRRVLGRRIHPFSIPLDIKVTDDSTYSKHVHVVDCVHKLYKVKPSEMVVEIQPSEQGRIQKNIARVCKWIPCSPHRSATASEKDGDFQIPLNYNHPVVELDRSGLNFKPQKEKEMAMSMNIEKSRSWFLSPWRKRTLVMPTLIIQEFTETVLRNFIAYEQFSPEVNYYFTSYASAMDMLIDSKADVGKLVESKVIVNNAGSNKEAATVIRSICVNIEIERFCFSEAIQELDTYYENSFANLKRTYFRSPWNYYNLIAGIILFGLTMVQTIFTVKSYYP